MKQFFTLLLALIAAYSASAQNNWPKTIKGDDGSLITIYEPQPEYRTGDEFTGRAAVSIRKAGNDEPVFGAMLFTATLNSANSGTIDVKQMRVTRLKFAGDEDETKLADITSGIEEDADSWNWGITEQQLDQSINKEKEASSGFNNTPPEILYTNKPTTLVVLDGEPKVLHDKNLDADKVANSPNIIVKDNNRWNLYAGGNWYVSNNITGNWKHNSSISSKLQSIDEQIKKQEKESKSENDNTSESPRVTNILVTTKPSELIQTDGEPVYKNVSGTTLLYVSNSPNDIFKDIESQKTYIVIAGRWYRAKNLKGPWEYVPADKLPADFAKIPEGSDKDAVLANVAGTDAAETAILDAAIPQTAKVDRRSATVDVEYDGQPYFVTIRGTSLRMAENANVTVIQDADGNYFALDNGIWFIGDDPYGPWTVANERPRDIDDIPASSPAYHSRYVYIYDYTPDYVYMGYTPGYLGSYVYGPTIIYGTGYHYRPWFRSVYYPRPWTWGFGFVYNPWYGWNINFGYNFGYSYFWYDHPGYYNYYGGWFGPYRYCPAYRRPYWGGYYGRGDYYYGRSRYGNRNYYGSAARPQRNYYGNNTGSRPSRTLGNNLYVNQQGVSTRNITRSTRVYRPNDQVLSRNTTTPMNGRYSNRLSPRQNENIDNRNSVRPSRPQNNSTIGRGGERPERVNDSRDPVIRRPQNDNNNRGNLPGSDGNRDVRRPRLTNPQQDDNRNYDNRTEQPTRPEVRRPQRTGDEGLQRIERGSNGVERPEISRPSVENRQQERARPQVERPNYENRQQERQRPAFERSSSENRTPPPVSRPSYENRQSAPSRPAFERPSSPAPRQNVERPSAPARSSAPASRGSEQGRRPQR